MSEQGLGTGGGAGQEGEVRSITGQEQVKSEQSTYGQLPVRPKLRERAEAG